MPKTKSPDQYNYYALINQLVSHNIAANNRMDQTMREIAETRKEFLETRKEFAEIKEQIVILIHMISKLPQVLQDKIGFSNK